MLSEIKNNGLLAELKRVEELEKSESILREEKASLENLIKNVDIIVKKPFTVNSLTKAIRDVLIEKKVC